MWVKMLSADADVATKSLNIRRYECSQIDRQAQKNNRRVRKEIMFSYIFHPEKHLYKD